MILRLLGIVLLVFVMSACVRNEPFRTSSGIQDCNDVNSVCGSGDSIIERYDNFDLSFIEFTERGNLFDREKANSVFEFINEKTQKRENSQELDGVAVILYVHGWKHNAYHSDDNVLEFRSLLSKFAENDVVGNRRVIGLYVGWRGLSVDVPVLKELTYWERKSVAEEIGSGGVTEVLSRLHEILITQYIDHNLSKILYRNIYLITGHSLGGAIVLSALHDVFVDNLANAYKRNGEVSSHCEKLERFADGVILLNPALEANKAMQMKELSSDCQFPNDQAKLMHVISSEADKANKVAFPAGQWLDLALTWNQEKLQRTVHDRQGGTKDITIDEYDLDLNTVGNLENFRTGRLSSNDDGQTWSYESCKKDLSKCNIKDQSNHFPVLDYNPLSFIYTDGNFIKDHNDIFNCKVQSYVATIVLETQTVDKGYGRVDERNKSRRVPSCDYDNFNFSKCFENQLIQYECK